MRQSIPFDSFQNKMLLKAREMQIPKSRLLPSNLAEGKWKFQKFYVSFYFIEYQESFWSVIQDFLGRRLST